jgi:hypothetical protein
MAYTLNTYGWSSEFVGKSSDVFIFVDESIL